MLILVLGIFGLSRNIVMVGKQDAIKVVRKDVGGNRKKHLDNKYHMVKALFLHGAVPIVGRSV